VLLPVLVVVVLLLLLLLPPAVRSPLALLGLVAGRVRVVVVVPAVVPAASARRPLPLLQAGDCLVRSPRRRTIEHLKKSED
jgi:hypothetical protein